MHPVSIRLACCWQIVPMEAVKRQCDMLACSHEQSRTLLCFVCLWYTAVLLMHLMLSSFSHCMLMISDSSNPCVWVSGEVIDVQYDFQACLQDCSCMLSELSPAACFLQPVCSKESLSPQQQYTVMLANFVEILQWSQMSSTAGNECTFYGHLKDTSDSSCIGRASISARSATTGSPRPIVATRPVLATGNLH